MHAGGLVSGCLPGYNQDGGPDGTELQENERGGEDSWDLGRKFFLYLR